MGFSWVDWVVIFCYIAAVTLFGLQFRTRQRSIHTYFLGGKNIPTWALSLSIVATETSTLTVIGAPGIAFSGNLSFLQVVLGYVVGRILVTIVLVPAYFKGSLFTPYQLLEKRFGQKIRRATAGLFLITRALADGVRIFATAIVISALLGIGEVWAILIIMVLTLIYTFEGGLAAVIWTDVIQLFCYVGGAIIVLVILLESVGGWDGVAANASDKFAVWNFSWDLSIAYTFWAGLIGGSFLTFASHGVDQIIVQRLLAARNARSSKIALLSSGVAVFFQFALFLVIGILLYSFYQYHPEEPVPTAPDRIFIGFALNHLPPGIAGLMVAAIFASAMSTLSSSLNSMASTTIIDFYKGSRGNQATESQQLKASKLATLLCGLVMGGLSILSRGVDSVLEAGLTIASMTYGSMLGVFLLGVLTKRTTEKGAIIGMGAGLLGMATLWSLDSIAWTWFVPIGTAITISVGYASSFLVSRTPR